MMELMNNNLQKEKISLWPAIIFSFIQLGTMADNTALLNASSAIAITYHASVSEIQVSNIMYPLMAGSIMITGGILGKMYGWKKLLQCGLVILIIGELLAVLSPNITVFVYCARVLVGIGASLTIPAVLGLITVLYKKKQQAAVFGLIAATIAFSTAASPEVSGFIIVYLNWESVFILLIALFSVCFIYVSFCLKKDNVSCIKKSFDYIGLLLLFIGLCSLIMGVLNIYKWGFIHPNIPPFTLFGYSPCLPFILVGIVLIVIFLKWERRFENKKGVDFVLIPSIFIKNKQIFSSVLMNAYVFFPLGGTVFLMFLFLQLYLNLSAISTGFVMLVFAVGMVPFSILTPILGKNFSPRTICIFGVLISVSGNIVFGFGINSLYKIGLLFYFGLFILGIGTGLVASQANYIVSASIKDKKLASQSSGIQGAMRNIGTVISVALIGVIFISVLTFSMKNSVSESSIINNNIKQQIISLENIQPHSYKTFQKILKTKYKLSDRSRQNIISLYAHASLFAFKITNIVFGIIMFLFIYFAKDICSEKLKLLQQSAVKLKEA
ncbi:MAG: MFS transporter [bacterium]|nr:MFS transporter [bacterium]